MSQDDMEKWLAFRQYLANNLGKPGSVEYVRAHDQYWAYPARAAVIHFELQAAKADILSELELLASREENNVELTRLTNNVEMMESLLALERDLKPYVKDA